MKIKDTFTPIADHLRAEYGVDGLLTTKQIKAGIGGLHISSNRLKAGLVLTDKEVPANHGYYLGVTQPGDWNAFQGKIVACSFDITWSGYKTVAGKNNRIGFEHIIYFKDGSKTVVPAWAFPDTENNSVHVYSNTAIPQKGIAQIGEGSFYNQLNPECTFKATNLKLVENPMGGGN